MIDRGLGHRRHHALAHPLLAQLADLALDHRVAFGLLELLLHLPHRHLLALVPLPVLEQEVGGGDQERGSRPPRRASRSASDLVSSSVPSRSTCTSPSSLCRCGHSSAVITAPSTAILIRPLTKLASACSENSRLMPASGEILLNLRLERLRRPHQAMLDHVAGDAPPAPAARAGSRSPRSPRTRSAPPSRSARARRPGSGARWRRCRASSWSGRRSSGRRTPRASMAAPPITNQVETSWLLATSPRCNASSRRSALGLLNDRYRSLASAMRR